MNQNFTPLLENLATYAKKVGRVAARPVLILYYIMNSPHTPRQEKRRIGLVLAYLVLPIDLISNKKHPIFGWTDEILSIAYITKRVQHLITPEIERQVDEQLDKWFGPSSAQPTVNQ